MVIKLTLGYTSILISGYLVVQGLLTGENGDIRSESAQKRSFPVKGVMGGELNTCHWVSLKMFNKTSAGCGHAKSTASLQKLAVYLI